MAQVHGRGQKLPDYRAELYEQVVDLLLDHWQKRIVRDARGGQRDEPGLFTQLGVSPETLTNILARVAFQAHDRQEEDPERADRTADISREELREELYAALGSYDKAELAIKYIQDRAGLLQARARSTYTFPHRSFQEYLAALHIGKEANPGETLAERVKRDLVWWREVFLLAAGHQRKTTRNVAELVDWLLPAPPDGAITAAQARLAILAGQTLHETDFSNYTKPEEPLHRFTATFLRVKEWLQAAMPAEAVPLQERAAAGSVLGRLAWPDGKLLDDRKGVGFIIRDRLKIPDIAWGGEVPAGGYTIGGDESAWRSLEEMTVPIDQSYHLARYPVTVAQFDCFAGAEDVDKADWWAGMPDDQKYAAGIRPSRWLNANRPRETVTWYQAVAFCRWLDHHLKSAGLIAEEEEIDLPHEYEWEVAARYAGDGQYDKRSYPWGGERITPEHANYDATGLGETSAVGLFPAGRQPELDLDDLSGNVWEWCRNKYKNPEETAVDDSGDSRALRGGSWSYDQGARARRPATTYNPHHRNDTCGFRLVRRLPSHHDR